MANTRHTSLFNKEASFQENRWALSLILSEERHQFVSPGERAPNISFVIEGVKKTGICFAYVCYFTFKQDTLFIHSSEERRNHQRKKFSEKLTVFTFDIFANDGQRVMDIIAALKFDDKPDWQLKSSNLFASQKNLPGEMLNTLAYRAYKDLLQSTILEKLPESYSALKAKILNPSIISPTITP